jgi:TRAP-type C4-dicarboxylate transport system permease small subunit
MVKVFYTWLNRIRDYALIGFSAFTVLLCLLQVFLRYFTFLSLRPFAWGDEVLRLTAVWVIFLGIGIGIRENSHFSVTLFLDKIKPPKVKKRVNALLDVVIIGVFCIIVYQGAVYTFTNTTSLLQNVELSMAWFYAAIPVGGLIAIIEYICKMIYGLNYKQVLLGNSAGTDIEGKEQGRPS